jgi:hypothetical protein
MKQIQDDILEFLEITASLSEILRQENKVLAISGRATGIQQFQTEKNALCEAYEQKMQIISNEDKLQAIDPNLASRLRDAVSSFSLLIEENAKRLKAKINAGEHLFKIISKCAIEHHDKSIGYSDKGSTVRDSQQAYRPAVSVGLDQKY